MLKHPLSPLLKMFIHSKLKRTGFFLFIEKLKDKILKSEFNRNVLTLASGTTISQAIPVLVSPILTRLYKPEDFGILALFISITSIISVVSMGRYELAIMLPEKHEDAINVAALAFIINFLVSIVSFVIIIILHKPIIKILNADKLSFWIYFVPLTIFFIGMFNILNYTNNRLKLYKDISYANVYKALAGAIFQVGLGFFKIGASGLITGQIFSQIIANTKLSKNIYKMGILKEIKNEKIKDLAVKYQNFPKYSMWAGLMNTSAFQIINILIASFYGSAALGYYLLAQRVLGMPTALLGSAISRVFFQQASEERQKTGNAIKTFKSTLRKFLIISIPTFVILFLVVEDLFAIVFGEKWRIAGYYTMLLIPLFFTRFIVYTFTLIPIIFEKNNIDLIFQSGIISLSVIIIIINQNNKFENFILIYSIILSIYYLSFLLFNYLFFLKKEKIK